MSRATSHPTPAASTPTRVVAHHVALAAVLLLAVALRTWNLAGHGTGNLYYAAAARSMSAGGPPLWFASFDPAGFVSVDKPPLALWIQVLMVHVLGYGPWALHLPAVLAGLACVWLTWRLGCRAAGEWGGVLAALVVAVFPACVAVDRSNLPDSVVLLALLAAAECLLRAVATGRLGWLLLSMVCVGAGFHAKMIAAWMALPALLLTYLLFARGTLRARALRLLVAGPVLLAASLAWFIAVDLTPPQSRPYVGGTRYNSALELALGGFGVDRLLHRGRPGEAPARTPGGPPGPGGHRPPPGREFTGQGGPPGPLRLVNRDLGGHASWLLLPALIGVALAARVPRRAPPDERQSGAMLWTLWLLTYGLVFSVAGGPVHPYYTNLLAPAIAILVALASVTLHERMIASPSGGLLSAAFLALGAGWQLWILPDGIPAAGWLVVILTTGTALAVAVITSLASRTAASAVRAKRLGFVLGLAALLVPPTYWSLMPAAAPMSMMVPTADPVLLGALPDARRRAAAQQATRDLAEYLSLKHGSERYSVASADIHAVAPLVVEAGLSVMAWGGFQGQDPILTAEDFAGLVAAGQVRFVLVGSLPGPGRFGPARADPIAEWVRAHGEVVPAVVWSRGAADAALPPHVRGPGVGSTVEIVERLFVGGGVTLYDCRPEVPSDRGRPPALPLPSPRRSEGRPPWEFASSSRSSTGCTRTTTASVGRPRRSSGSSKRSANWRARSPRAMTRRT